MLGSKVAIIDADSICFICSKDSLMDSFDACDNLIENLKYTLQVDEMKFILSTGRYFRHDINKDYKANRPPVTLEFVKELKNYLIDKYDAFGIPLVEADDTVAYLKAQNPDAIMCGIDKDLLNQVAGKHFNYRTWEFVETSTKEALFFLFYQTIAGDPGDNVKGIKGVGDKGARKLLGECVTREDFTNTTINAYVDKYGISHGIYLFQQNFRQVYLLKTKQNFIDEIGYFPDELK